MSRYTLTDFEWRVIKPLLPNKPRGVPRVDDPPRAERHLLGATVQCSLARPARALWLAHRLLQPLQQMAASGRVGPPDGRHQRGARRRDPDNRQRLRSRPPAGRNGKKGGM